MSGLPCATSVRSSAAYARIPGMRRCRWRLPNYFGIFFVMGQRYPDRLYDYSIAAVAGGVAMRSHENTRVTGGVGRCGAPRAFLLSSLNDNHKRMARYADLMATRFVRAPVSGEGC